MNLAKLVDKYQLALEEAQKNRPLGGCCGLELEWNLLDDGLQLRAFHGRVVAAVPRDGRNLYECCLTGPIALVLGSEGSGVSAKLLKETDEVISIPMAPGAESLNAAAAAAVCLFEMVRQRSWTGGQGPGARGDAVTRPLTPDP